MGLSKIFFVVGFWKTPRISPAEFSVRKYQEDSVDHNTIGVTESHIIFPCRTPKLENSFCTNYNHFNQIV